MHRDDHHDHEVGTMTFVQRRLHYLLLKKPEEILTIFFLFITSLYGYVVDVFFFYCFFLFIIVFNGKYN